MTSTTTQYTCRPPSIAHTVISFFVANPDEALTCEDIVTKWGVKPNSLSGLLLQAKKSGAIMHNGGLYMLGDMATAKLCIDPDAAPDLPTPPAPEPPTAPAPIPLQAKAAAPAPARSVTIPGVGELAITYEPLVSKATVYAHKWDPLFDQLIKAKILIDPDGLATVRLPRAMAGAVKSGIESWHKRHKGSPLGIRFRLHVSGDQVIVQRVA